MTGEIGNTSQSEELGGRSEEWWRGAQIKKRRKF